MKSVWNTLNAVVTGVVISLILCGCGKTPSPHCRERRNLEVEANPQSRLVEGYLQPHFIGSLPGPEDRPWITDLSILDLDQDGLLDVVACEGQKNQIVWLRQFPLGTFTERVIGEPVSGPAHVSGCDVDVDGDTDLLIAGMGVIFPNDDKIGKVVIMEQIEPGQFKNHVLLENVARVTDVRGGDLDSDGDVDLSVAQFGYYTGEGRWMENKGDWVFESHLLTGLSGAVHSPIADLDGDGTNDILMLISQEWEELHLFQNLGTGDQRFETKRIYGSTNEDYGSSGIRLVDLDKDGDLDVVYTNGDAFDYARPGPRPWHGVQWLENMNRGYFRFHRLGDFAGAYSPVACDIDNDGDLDVLAVSGFNHWESPEAYSLVCFENCGWNRFQRRMLARKPTHLIVLDAADTDGDGQIELVTGSFHAYPPYDSIGRIMLWDTSE